MIAKDCPANYQTWRIAANIAKLPELLGAHSDFHDASAASGADK